MRRRKIFQSLAAALSFSIVGAAQANKVIELGIPIEVQLAGGHIHSYKLDLRQGEYVRLSAEQNGIDIVLALIGPNDRTVIEVDSPNGTKGEEQLFFVADTAGQYTLDVRSLEHNASEGKYRIILLEDRPATKDDLIAASKFIGNKAVGYFGRDNVMARDLAARALGWAENADKKDSVASMQGLIGNTYAMEGALTRAVEYHIRALAIWEELKHPNAALASNNLGIAFSQLGDDESARGNFERAHQLMIAAGRKADAAVMLYNIAILYRGRGDYMRAMEYLQQSDTLFKEAGIREMPPDLAINFAGVYRRKGDIDLAITYYNKALLAFEARKSRYGVYQTLAGLGAAYLDKNDPERSIEYLKRAVELQRQMNSRLDMASTLRQIGEACAEVGRLAEAQQYYDEALNIAIAAQSPTVEADILASTARLALIQGKTADAVKIGLKAREKVLPLKDQYRSPELHTTLARSYLALGNRAETKKSLIAAIEDVEFVSGAFIEATAPAKDTVRTPYDLLTGVLIELGEDNKAWQAAERARSRILIDAISNGGRRVEQAMSHLERDAEKTILLELTSLNKQLVSAREQKFDPSEIERLSRELSDKRLALEDLRMQTYAAHPELRVARGEMKRISMAEISQMVDGRTALLEYVVTDDKTYLFVITKGVSAPRLKVFTVDGDRKDLARKVELYKTKLENGDLDFSTASRELYGLLLSPAERLIAGKTDIVIVPDGHLWDLPFQALMDEDGKYLIEKAAISYAPSLTALREMKKRSKGRAVRTESELLAFGNPIVGKDTSERVKRVFMSEKLDPLPEAERLVAGLAKMYGPGRSKVFTGAAAREQIAKDEAPKFRIVQFATHGILNNVSPMYSHLVLARDEKNTNEDGLLEAWEMKDLDLKADMVILSACDTARGRISGGEGVVGMTWAMFIAGAPTTVASQWKVESSSTTEFMLEFHRQLLGKQKISKAEALRRASLKLMKTPKYRHPSYWGAWVMVGDGS